MRIFFSFLKIVFWIALAVVLFVAGFILATVNVLTPERLTPMVNTVANKMLNAKVETSAVELSIRHSWPFLDVDISDLSVQSTDILNLPPRMRDTLPVWADTLVAAKHIHAGLNVMKLASKMVELHDIEITQPRINVLVVDEHLNNFSIIRPSRSEDSDSVPDPVSDIRLNRFRLISPSPVRFTDMANKVDMQVSIQDLSLVDEARREKYLPAYRVDFAGAMDSETIREMGIRSIDLSLNGVADWRYTQPYRLKLSDFAFSTLCIAGTLDADIDFTDDMTVETMRMSIEPVAVDSLLALVPEAMAREYSIPRYIDTNAKIGLTASLSQPYVVGNTAIPCALVELNVPPSYLKYEKMDIRHLAAAVDIELPGDKIDDALVHIKHIKVQGPATSLEVSGKVSHLTSDPLFEGSVNGHSSLAQLPGKLTERFGGIISGTVRAHADMAIRPSMFCRERFHTIRVKGDVGVDDFYYLAYDTLTMMAAHRLSANFGTNEKTTTRSGFTVDSLLKATVQLDTASILVSGLDIRLGKVKLGVGASNKGASSDTTAIIPMGGGLSARTFSLYAISDTAGVKVMDIAGNVTMRRYKGDAHLPSFYFNLGLRRVSTGSNHTRLLINDGKLKFNLNKLPDDELSKGRRTLRRLTDSLRRQHPQIPVDSVYIMAKEIRQRNHRPGYHRVHPVRTDSASEVIDWNASRFLTALLLDWSLRGTLATGGARMFTTAMPIPNRLENLNVEFSNDSVLLTDVKYKAGRSDFLLSGRISNLKRGLTSKRGTQSVKVHFDMLSDTVDVNEIAGALFAGSAVKHSKIPDLDSEEALHKSLEEMKEKSDSVAPFIVPTNIDAELDLKVGTALYSDIALKGLTGRLLVYDGAINLHGLQASSAVGRLDLTALYSAPTPDNMDFGFGMKLNDFNVRNFLKLVPAVDSMMPLMRDLSGIINADIAATSKVSKHMDLDLPSLRAAIRIDGDSISFLDPETFNKIAKWLLFKDKNRNIINHFSAEMVISDGQMDLYPFIFDFDRYKIGIQGYNDFDMNFKYHVAVLKSPIPFKFGINVSGNIDNLKIRLGGAHFNEKTTAERRPIVSDTRVNLINQIQNVFRRGVKDAGFATIHISDRPLASEINLATDTITAADSLYLKQQGLIP